MADYLTVARRREYRVKGAGVEEVVLGWASDGDLCMAEMRFWTASAGKLMVERRRTGDGSWIQKTTTFASDRWEVVSESVIEWPDEERREWVTAVQDADIVELTLP